jgi:dTDP-4-amino-4,6-dideoxygalactose transaminase
LSAQPSIPVIDLKRQHAAMQADLDAAIRRVVDSGRYMSGPETEAFEREWAAYCGTAEAAAVGSGTAALNLTLRALGVGHGDEVVTVAFTLSATLDAIIETGATPVLIDVDPDTYTMAPALVKKHLSPRTKAVLPVHIYGHPADMDAIAALAGGLPVIADACEAHGALYKGRQATEFATASCFSFYPTKNLNALGDAGAIVTNDAALAERLRRLRHHGWDRRFHSAASSLNSRMDELQAAILRAKLIRLDAWNARRRAIAQRFDEALAGSSAAPAAHAPWADPCYYLYVVRTPRRQALREALSAAGIATDIHWPEPPHLQPAFASLGYGRGSLPLTERLCDEVLTIPMFAELTEAEIGRICDALRRFAR